MERQSCDSVCPVGPSAAHPLTSLQEPEDGLFQAICVIDAQVESMR